MAEWFSGTIDINWARRLGSSEKSREIISTTNVAPYDRISEAVGLRSLGGLTLRFDADLRPHTNGLERGMLNRATLDNSWPVPFPWNRHNIVDLAEPDDAFVVTVTEWELIHSAECQRRLKLAAEIMEISRQSFGEDHTNDIKWALPLRGIVRTNSSEYPPFRVPYKVVRHLGPEVLFSDLVADPVE